jgi:hypothetical protein
MAGETYRAEAGAAVQEAAISTPVELWFMVEIKRSAWFTCFLSL